MDFSDDELERYARQIVLPEVGGVGQARLRAARVLVVGAGGLGAPLLLYLAAAGIGTLGILDDDAVEVSNLHRQVLYRTSDAGRRKVDAARASIEALNPELKVVALGRRLTQRNAGTIIDDFDIIADGCDNLETRTAVHDAAMAAHKPLVSGAVQGMDGQLTTFKAFLGPPHPCMHCLFETLPSGSLLPTCAQGGVLGPAAGVVGTLQALEVVKEILGCGAGLSGTLLLFDARRPELMPVRLKRSERCGAHPGGQDGLAHRSAPPAV